MGSILLKMFRVLENQTFWCVKCRFFTVVFLVSCKTT